VVLSIVSRSITDISLSSKDEDSARAFSVAEAGIENLIIGGPKIGDIGGGSYSAGSIGFGENTSSINYDDIGKFYSGEDVTVWFVSHDENNKFTCSGKPCYRGDTSFKACWGNPGTAVDDDKAPAVEISFYYDETGGSIGSTPNYSGVKVARVNYDPKLRGNNFLPALSGCNLGDKSYAFSTGDINIPVRDSCKDDKGCLLFARVKFIYNDTIAHGLGVSVSSGSFPAQGRLLSSSGTYAGATRKMQVVDLFKSPLGIFESGLFSAGSEADLIKE
jgi:hypothetical protein